MLNLFKAGSEKLEGEMDLEYIISTLRTVNILEKIILSKK
jgi:hypothetical protein